jgi:hypothetical protein
MKKIFLVPAFLLILITGFTQNFNAGDKVEIFNSGGWYKGTVVETGSGSMAGYYSVKYDGSSQLQWMKASNIRLQKKDNSSTGNGSGPRNGRYIILSYGNPSNPLRLGFFDLSAGEYTYYDMAKKYLGKGSYVYDVTGKSIDWTSGPFREAHWGGAFESDREGKTHKIRLNSVTIGSNSSDSN